MQKFSSRTTLFVFSWSVMLNNSLFSRKCWKLRRPSSVIFVWLWHVTWIVPLLLREVSNHSEHFSPISCIFLICSLLPTQTLTILLFTKSCWHSLIYVIFFHWKTYLQFFTFLSDVNVHSNFLNKICDFVSSFFLIEFTFMHCLWKIIYCYK